MMLSNRCTVIVRKSFDVINLPKLEHMPEDPIEIKYHLKRDSNGNCFYVETDKVNVKNYIASFANGCSLKAILDRCTLMPTHEKIAYMNQRPDSLSADLSSMPKDGTEAQIMLRKVKEYIPDYAQRIKNGESFESLINALFSTKSGDCGADSGSHEADPIVNNNISTSSGESEVK